MREFYTWIYYLFFFSFIKQIIMKINNIGIPNERPIIKDKLLLLD